MYDRRTALHLLSILARAGGAGLQGRDYQREGVRLVYGCYPMSFGTRIRAKCRDVTKSPRPDRVRYLVFIASARLDGA